MRVLEIRSAVRPWRFIVGPRTASITVELPAGLADAQRIRTGDVVQWP
jgi:uncharacterized membrane protein (UPF0127 family)